MCLNFRYPFPWETVSAFVLREKAKGPPDDMVTLEVDDRTFKYKVRMPWYARLVLGKSITWHDVLQVNQKTKALVEDGMNVSLRRLGTVRDVSSWRAHTDCPWKTAYNKRLDFRIRMPLGPTIMAQVALPLMRWFESKSHLCRELEVKAIQEFLDKGETEEERKARMEEDAAWMATLHVEKLLLFDPDDEAEKDAHANEKAKSG